MPSRPTILLIVSLPVGAVAYTVAARVLEAVLPGEGILTLLLPLFVAGLVMIPFLIPFFDRKAKQDLAEYRSRQAPARDGTETDDSDSDLTDEPTNSGGSSG